MGGFIVGDERGCNQCGRVEHDDSTPVTWVCGVCEKRVCRFCALRDATGRMILCATLCSQACKEIYVTESTMVGLPVDEELR